MIKVDSLCHCVSIITLTAVTTKNNPFQEANNRNW